MQNPNDVKSQDDTRAVQDKRSVDVLVHAVEKCERLQKQLDIAVKCLERYADHQNWQDECTGAEDCLYIEDFGYREAEQALEQIRELKK